MYFPVLLSVPIFYGIPFFGEFLLSLLSLEDCVFELMSYRLELV